jgi:hypothetical protein
MSLIDTRPKSVIAAVAAALVMVDAAFISSLGVFEARRAVVTFAVAFVFVFAAIFVSRLFVSWALWRPKFFGLPAPELRSTGRIAVLFSTLAAFSAYILAPLLFLGAGADPGFFWVTSFIFAVTVLAQVFAVRLAAPRISLAKTIGLTAVELVISTALAVLVMAALDSFL